MSALRDGLLERLEELVFDMEALASECGRAHASGVDADEDQAGQAKELRRRATKALAGIAELFEG